ncbi:hypothetical protein [Xanthocytophaga flava]|uniref:hypothetical protein n=1 Tax=Xanthocytophaga flava TaxID=3048013 RepID=UPI0028D561E7|nr:hypothetical protein [Xanthocytophaga flavus]MDJ1472819.1 hypothetical protein [Xanthocytophaga flavus]
MENEKESTKEEEVTDFGSEEGNSKFHTKKYESFKERFALVLIALTFGLLLIISAAFIIINPTEGVKQVFDFYILFMSNIVTLILGYFFGNRNKHTERN